MVNDHVFYIGICPNNGESIITVLPFYQGLSPEKRKLFLEDLLGWVQEQVEKGGEVANG